MINIQWWELYQMVCQTVPSQKSFIVSSVSGFTILNTQVSCGPPYKSKCVTWRNADQRSLHFIARYFSIYGIIQNAVCTWIYLKQ